MKQIKGLELISGVELTFGSCFIGTINMRSKEISKERRPSLRYKKTINLSDTLQKLEQVPNQRFGTFLNRKNVLVSLTTSKGLEGLRRHLKLMSFLGEQKTFHNMERRQEYFREGRYIIVKVYNGKRKVWKRKVTAHDPKQTTSRVKHGGGNVMAWACWLPNDWVHWYLLMMDC